MADIQVKRKTSVKPRVTFYDMNTGDPQNVDSGMPTVTATFPDGTLLTPAPTATNIATGVYEIALSGQPQVTWLDLTVTGNIGGESQTPATPRVEWVGEYLFTVSEFRQLKVAGGAPFADEVAYPAEKIAETRTEVLQEFEDILGFSLVPRFYREVKSVGYGGQVILSELHVQRILSVSVAGVAQVAANYFVADGGILLAVSNYAGAPWTSWGYGVVVVEYEAGWPRVKGDARDVAMLRVAMKLDPGISSNATTVSTPDGTTYSYDPAGQVYQRGNAVRVRHFGVPAIDAFLNRHSRTGLAVA